MNWRWVIVVGAFLGILLLLGLGRRTQVTHTGPPPTVTVHAADISYTPDELVVPAGTVILRLTNDGTLQHNLVLSDAGGTDLFGIPDQSAYLGAGQSASKTVALAAGRYTFYCSKENHYQLGMEGVLVVK